MLPHYFEKHALKLRHTPGVTAVFVNTIFSEKGKILIKNVYPLRDIKPVSYTHLTLPTKRIV